MVTLADLIIHGLSGEHLHGFLPGNDRRHAISHAVASKHGWGGPDGSGEVQREGIGHWLTGCMPNRKRSSADLFITWDEVLAVIERGCSVGHRQAYEAAYHAWFDGVHKAWEGYRPSVDPFPKTPDEKDIRATTVALIRHGCEQLEIQDALW